jgi:hypothetical protein
VSLRDWLRNGWLTEHEASVQEIADLLDIVERDLADCQASGLSSDWQLNIAYNAALQAATAALAAAGYRAEREAHHYRVIQSLTYTIEASPELVFRFDQFRKKRNIGGYERMGMTSDREAREMISLAGELREKVIAWLRTYHPHLLRE